MKTVGLITIQKAPENYGACLQAYALWSFLDDRGFDCSVIDLLRPWHPSYIFSSKDSEYTKSIKSKIIRYLFGKRAGLKMLNSPRNKAFEIFNGKIKYTKQYNSVDELYRNPPVFDYYVSGSDQIWNPNLNVVNEPYFLTFVKHGVKISYASSFAINELSSEQSLIYSRWLESYSTISVREEDGLHIIKNMGLSVPSTCVLDPTFLLTSEKWKSLAKIVPEDEPFIFVYLLHENETINSYIRDIAKRYCYKVKMVISDTAAVVPNDFESLMNIGPDEWIGYIYSSKCVFTDSFHCTVFSLLMEKSFQTITTNTAVSSRMKNMLEKFGLKNCLKNIDEIRSEDFLFHDLDYTTVNSLIETERNRSVEFLFNSLS